MTTRRSSLLAPKDKHYKGKMAYSAVVLQSHPDVAHKHLRCDKISDSHFRDHARPPNAGFRTAIAARFFFSCRAVALGSGSFAESLESEWSSRRESPLMLCCGERCFLVNVWSVCSSFEALEVEVNFHLSSPLRSRSMPLEIEKKARSRLYQR